MAGSEVSRIGTVQLGSAFFRRRQVRNGGTRGGGMAPLPFCTDLIICMAGKVGYNDPRRLAIVAQAI